MTISFSKLISSVVFVSICSVIACAQGAAPAQHDHNVVNGAGQGSAQAPPRNIPTFAERSPRYQLRPGDVLDLSFKFSPEFNQTVTVQPDGFISLQEVGDLLASGETVPALTEKVQHAYGNLLASPVVSILLKEFEKPYFTAAGQVAKPGRYELRGNTTVIEGIAAAGGFTSASKHSQVLLVRRISDQWSEAKLLNIKKIMASKDLNEDVYLRPGDMLIIPQNTISKFRSFIPNAGVTLLPSQF